MLILSSPFLWGVFQVLIPGSQTHPQAARTAGCGDGWVEFEGQCIRFVHEAANGYSARWQCYEFGGDLAQITNHDADAFSAFIATIGQPGGNPHHFWQIIPQDNGCNIFTWLNDGTPIIKPVPCDRGGIWFICAGGRRWSKPVLGCIRAHNNKHLRTSNIEECKDACRKETDFTCRSLDYSPGGYCALSTEDSTSAYYMEPCWGSYYTDLFTEIIFERECPEGFLVLGQCFRIFKDTTRSWEDAASKCRSENLILAEPSDTVAAPLREYVVEVYGTGECWLGARGDGSKHVWEHSGKSLLSSNTLWDNGYLNSNAMINGYCLELDSNQADLESKPAKPYDVDACTVRQWTLCEDLQE